MTDDTKLIIILLGCAVGIAALIMGSVRIVDGYAAVQAEAAVEQLGSDVWGVDVLSNEDVMGQITEWNQTIRSKQRLKDTFWGGIVTSSRWRMIELIEIGLGGKG